MGCAGGVQVTVADPVATLRVIRVVGRLDRSAAAGVLRLLRVQ